MFSVEYRIVAATTGDTVATGTCRIQAGDEAQARTNGVKHGHDDKRTEPHLDAVVELLSVEELPSFVGTFHFGGCYHKLTIHAADEDEAFALLEEPADELRPAIQVAIKAASRDPFFA
jgi:hypothetical protein